MKELRQVLSGVGAILLICVCLACAAEAADIPTQDAPGIGTSAREEAEVPADLLERWRSMSPEERNKIRDRYRRWKELPAGERERILERNRLWRRLPEAQRTYLKERRELLRDASPRDRQVIRKFFVRMRSLPPNARRIVRGKIWEWRSLPPATRVRRGVGAAPVFQPGQPTRLLATASLPPSGAPSGGFSFPPPAGSLGQGGRRAVQRAPRAFAVLDTSPGLTQRRAPNRRPPAATAFNAVMLTPVSPTLAAIASRAPGRSEPWISKRTLPLLPQRRHRRVGRRYISRERTERSANARTERGTTPSTITTAADAHSAREKAVRGGRGTGISPGAGSMYM